LKLKFKILLTLIFLFIFAAASLDVFICREIPCVFYAENNNEKIRLKNAVAFIPIVVKPCKKLGVSAVSFEDSYDASLTVFNIPVKKVKVNIEQREQIVPGGDPFGIRIFTEGVMVIDSACVETEAGDFNPAQKSGIKKGDVIAEIDGKKIDSNEALARLVQESNGKTLDCTVIRGNLKFNTNLIPVKAVNEGVFRIGIWVRDSSAGIGTLTFYGNNGDFAGLGHGIRDSDTEEIIPLSHGDIMRASIRSVVKGTRGVTGELRGGFLGAKPMGTITANTEFGVYGKISEPSTSGQTIPIAFKQEVEAGDAKIISTVEGNEPTHYDIKIENINFNRSDLTKNISILVTDEALLSKTGGIVQGMSGSPIIQKGRLVGAITHVFVNDPKRGYAIFAETMLKNLLDLPEK
jgi:stage IV sporulation protein B